MPVCARLMHKYLAVLAQLVGAWTCTGTQQESILGPAHATRATLSVVSRGAWLEVHFAEQRSADVPVPEIAEERWGFDESAHKYLRFLFDSFGGFGTAVSDGLADGKLIWTGEYRLGGEKLAFRETFAVAGKALSDVFELGDNGQWKPVLTATCKRK